MILRAAAALSLLAGIATSIAYLHIMGKSPTASAAARHMRDMKDRTTEPAGVEPVDFAAIAALPARLHVAEYSAFERRAVALEGHVQRVVRAADGDFHLEIVPASRQPGEPALDYVTGEITPQWHRGSTAWSYARVVELFRPLRGGVTAWESGTRRVRISGWLLYDYEYEGAPAYRYRRLTSWEIHPVTRIEAWDDSLGRFVEYRR